MPTPTPTPIDIAQLQSTLRGFFPEQLGVRFLAASIDEIRAEVEIPRTLCTLPGRMHGGAIMAFADTLGAYGTVLNLTGGAGTTTLESKTNFFSAGLEGGKLIGVCRPVHRGRSTMVWQTRVEREDGTLVALVTQTQLVLAPKTAPADPLDTRFAELEPQQKRALLDGLEGRKDRSPAASGE
jgi:1,4-dihydroxy-2-naphthoyl-CoA hydrolase